MNRVLRWCSSATQDCRYAIRLFRRDAALSLTAALAIALGLGATNTVLTIVNTLMVRGLPEDVGNRIVRLRTVDGKGRQRGTSYLDFRDWRDSTRSFAGIAAFVGRPMTMSVDGQSVDREPGAYVTSNAFRLLHQRPFLGRDFVADDDRQGAAGVVILGHRVWTALYGRDPAAVGRTISVNDITCVIVGVMPEGFKFPDIAELWLPIGALPGLDGQKRDERALGAFARLSDGVDISSATAELRLVAENLSSRYPATNRDVRPVLMRFTEQYGTAFSQLSTILLAAIGVLLLVTCGNVANLLLARAIHRGCEISIRRSMGASGPRIVQQLFVESLMLAIVGGIGGYLLSMAAVRLFAYRFEQATQIIGIRPYWVRFTMDVGGFSIFAAVCVSTAIVFGLAPALYASRTNIADLMNEDVQRSSSGARARWWTQLLVAAEVGLTLVLVSSSVLMATTLRALYRGDRVVETSRVLTMRLLLPEVRYRAREQRLRFFEELDRRLATIPTISSASVSSFLPFVEAPIWPIEVEGAESVSDQHATPVSVVFVGRHYFDTLNVRLLRGQTFDDVAGPGGANAVIINERLATMLDVDGVPSGRRLRFTSGPLGGENAQWLTIIGVSPTVRQQNSGGLAIERMRDFDPVVYLPYSQRLDMSAALIVRVPSDPMSIVSTVRQEIRAIDREAVTFDVRTMDDVLAASKWPHVMVGGMLFVFSVVAVSLSAIGLYAVIAFAVMKRQKEIGIRMALGADVRQVVWLFVLQGMRPVVAGLLVGSYGVFTAGRIMRSFLIQTDAVGPGGLAIIALLLIAVSLAACGIPARAAARREPLRALRQN